MFYHLNVPWVATRIYKPNTVNRVPDFISSILIVRVYLFWMYPHYVISITLKCHEIKRSDL